MTFVHTGGAPPGGDGPPILFLAGAGMDHTVWRFQTRWLAHRGWGVLAPDLPAHGASPGPPLRSVEAMADWVADVVLPGPMTIVGHSMGAFVALEVAARRPDLAGRLVLVGATASMAVHPGLEEAAAHDLPRAARIMAEWSFPRAFAGGHPHPGMWEQGGMIRLLEKSRPGVLATDLEACRTYDPAHAAGQVGVPALLVVGTEDRMTAPAGAVRLAEWMARAETVWMLGCGHEPMVQAPGVFNRTFERWAEGDRAWSPGPGASRNRPPD